MSEQYAPSCSCFWSLQFQCELKVSWSWSRPKLLIYLWLRVLLNVCAYLCKVGQPCIANLQVMWADEWVKCAQNSQKVCTKLFSLPNNAKFLFTHLKLHSPQGSTLSLTTSYGTGRKLTFRVCRPHRLFWSVWLRGGKGSNFLESQQSKFTVFEVKSVFWPLDWM